MDKHGLAVEAARILTKKDGASVITRQIGEVKITDVKLSADAAERIGRREGRYITLHGEPDAEGLTGLLRRALLQLIPPRGRLFAAGLGNPDVTQDSLGAVCVRSMTARKGCRYSMAAIETDVAAKTGLETARLVKAAARELKADCVIAIDALSCGDPSYIGKTVQLGSAGIIPGSGAGAGTGSSTGSGRGAEGELTPELLGCSVVSVGVPTVTALSSVTHEQTHSKYLISPADIDTIINMWAEVIGGAIDSIVGG